MAERLRPGVGTASVWFGGSRVGGFAVSALLTPLLVAKLGPERYGVWILSLAIIGLLGIGGAGADAALGQVTAQARAHGDDTRRLIRISLAIATVEGGVLAAALIVLAPTLIDAFDVAAGTRPAAIGTLRIAALAHIANRWATVGCGGLSGLGRYGRRVVVETVGSVVFALTAIAVLLVGGGLEAVAFAYLFAGLVTSTWAALALRPAVGGRELSTRRILRELWRLGRPRQISRLVVLTNLSCERLLVGVLAGATASGRLGAAMSAVAAVAAVGVSSLTPVGTELAVHAVEDGAQAVRAIHRRATRSTAVLAAGALGALSAAAVPFMTAWVGPEVATPGYVMVLAPGYYAWVVSRVGFQAAVALGEPWFEARAAAWAALLNVAGAAVLLSTAGPVVAGAATSASMLIWAALFARTSRRVLGQPPLASLVVPGLLAAAVATTVAACGAAVVNVDAIGSRVAMAAFAVGLGAAFLALYVPLVQRLPGASPAAVPA